MLIVNEFITDIETCKEVNQYIIDKIDYFVKCYGKKPPNFPVIMDKIFLYVNLFCSVCDTKSDLKSENTTADNCVKDVLSENYISIFWQERLCPEEEQIHSDFDDSESEISSLERSSIVASVRHPLLAALAHEAITKTRHLVETRLSESQTDSEDCSFSLT